MPRPATDPEPDTTRDSLIQAATGLFGRQGFKATTVRQIAAQAGGQNVALISYHFGSKEGLRMACARALVQRMQSIFPPVDGDVPDDPAMAAGLLEAILSGILEFITHAPEAEDMIAFALREISQPGEAFDLIYSTMIEERHRLLCRLWGITSGTDPESDATKLAVFSMLGQVLYFRIGRPVIQRRMNWTEMGRGNVTAIRKILSTNLRAALAAHKGDAS